MNDLILYDSLYSDVYSYDHRKVADFLKSRGLVTSVVTYVCNKVEVPALMSELTLDSSNVSDLGSLFKEMEFRYRWMPSHILTKGGLIRFKSIDELISSLTDYVASGNSLTIQIKWKPIYLDPKRSKLPKDELNQRFLYHLTDSMKVRSILSSGLKPFGSMHSVSDKGYYQFNCVHLLRYLSGPLCKYNSGKLLSPMYPTSVNLTLLKIGPVDDIDNLVLFIDPDSPLDGLVTPYKIEPNFISAVPREDLLREFVNNNINRYRIDNSVKFMSDVFVGIVRDLDEVTDSWIHDNLEFQLY